MVQIFILYRLYYLESNFLRFLFYYYYYFVTDNKHFFWIGWDRLHMHIHVDHVDR
jgi:hypothetical protein